MTSYRWTRHKTVDAAGIQAVGDAPISLWWLARAAAEETLQGSPMVSAWLTLFRSHLSGVEQHDLRWGGDLAESAELRRSYSGLYGRFMARALLTSHLGLDRFVSLQRNGIALPGSIAVRRICAGDIPDWLAWDDRNGQFVLCEAKGSLTANDFLTGNPPTCVKVGKEQFMRVESTIGTSIVHPAEWVAASRWATDDRPRTAITLLWDPPVQRALFSPNEAASHREAITRAWLASLAPGFGRSSADDMLTATREGRGVVVRANPGPIPKERDWPPYIDDEQPEFAQSPSTRPDRVGASSPQRPVTLDGTAAVSQDGEQRATVDLASAPIYEGRDILVVRPRETKPIEGGFVVALATRYGVRPIRAASDLEELSRVQDRARRLEEPAMLFGIPYDFDPRRTYIEERWVDGAGIAPSNDLAVFDLREVTIHADGKLVA